MVALMGMLLHTSPVVAFVEELSEWEEAAPVRLLDEIEKLKAKVEFLEAEIRPLKREQMPPAKRIRSSH
ncbi:MAG: hypothetical protein WBV36_04735 [Terriglobales bacterium]